MALDENAKEITIIWNIENIDVNTYLSYYPYVLQQVKEELKVLEIYSDALRVEEGFLVLVATTQIEQERLEGCLEKINRIYKNLGYKFNIDVELRHEDNILEEIKQDLVVNVKLKEKHEEKKEEQPKEKKYHKEPKDPNSVIGRGIKEEAIKIKTLLGEDNNVVVEGYVFGTDYFESSKTDFKIITLKITDYSDSIYCKVFVRDNDEYKRLCKELKAGSWFKIRGYTKEDQFAKELVLNARDIVKIDKKEEYYIFFLLKVKFSLFLLKQFLIFLHFHFLFLSLHFLILLALLIFYVFHQVQQQSSWLFLEIRRY